MGTTDVNLRFLAIVLLGPILVLCDNSHGTRYKVKRRVTQFGERNLFRKTDKVCEKALFIFVAKFMRGQWGSRLIILQTIIVKEIANYICIRIIRLKRIALSKRR